MPWVEDRTYEFEATKAIPILPIIIAGGSLLWLLILLTGGLKK